MRRKEFISKKLAVVLLSAVMAFAPIVGSAVVPVYSIAADNITVDDLLENHPERQVIPDNSNPENVKDEINENEIMDINNGVVNENAGIIVNNNGVVKESTNYVYENNADGKIVDNAGDVYENYGEIVNHDTGSRIYQDKKTIQINYGTVINNHDHVNLHGGKIVNQYDGYVHADSYSDDKETMLESTIVNCYGGSVINPIYAGAVLTVENNYASCFGNASTGLLVDGQRVQVDHQGTYHIINNYDGVDHTLYLDAPTIIDNQNYSVEVTEADNANVAYNGFEYVDYNKKQYVQVTANSEPIPITGTINIKANDGYKITDDGQLSGEAGQLTYNLGKNADGSYTVNISALGGNVTVTPAMLHLIISQLTGDETTEVKIGGATVNVDDIKDGDAIVIEGSSHSSSDNSGSPAEAAAPAGYNLADEAIKAVTDQVQKQVAASGNDIAALEVIDIYFGDKIDMSPAVIKYLCEKVPVAKRCHFDYKDQEYVMFIPAFDLVAPAYAEGLEVLNNEPAHTAGFLRITQIFEKLGFATKVVEEQEAAE